MVEEEASEAVAHATRLMEDRVATLEAQMHRIANLVNELWLRYQAEKRKR